MIYFGIDHAGFNNVLQCGTVNFFDGWVVNSKKNNPIKTVNFFIDDAQVGSIPIKMERPDLKKRFSESLGYPRLSGFYGICDIPETYLNKTLILYAIAKDGQSYFMQKYELADILSLEEKDFRINNALPDDILMHLVVHNVNPKSFLEEGKAGVETIKSILVQNDIDLLSMKNILDFGVGCGRVFRWWQEYSNNINFWGCDINPDLVNWCINNLDFGYFSINSLLPPHPVYSKIVRVVRKFLKVLTIFEFTPPSIYDSSQFDLVYLFSVFSHLTIETQKKWLSEFSRILIPGGILLVSVHGDFHAKNLPGDIEEIYRKNGYYVLTKNAEGENLCASYQSREFCEKLFSEDFKILDYYPGVFRTCGYQDLYCLRKI